MKLLLLLLGGNNIGNYALLDYFSRPESGELQFEKAVLISTNKTSHFVEKFRQLKPELQLEEINIENNERNLTEIENIVYRELKKLSPSLIHLNYTGGTKPMAIGTFLAVEKLEREGVRTYYSDISPDSSRITFRDGKSYPEKGSLTQYVKLSIEELFLLHGIELADIKREIDPLAELRYDREEILNYLNSPREERDLFPYYYRHQGEWLELFLFDILRENGPAFKLSDIAMNVKGTLYNQGGENNDFEIDVLAVKGYTPFIFSCTASSHWGSIRNRAFEVFLRATQIGGIRGIPVIVSPFITPEREARLRESFQTYVGRSKLQIVGENDLKNLPNLHTKLLSIFTSN
jgi:hypothetical protein